MSSTEMRGDGHGSIPLSTLEKLRRLTETVVPPRGLTEFDTDVRAAVWNAPLVDQLLSIQVTEAEKNERRNVVVLVVGDELGSIAEQMVTDPAVTRRTRNRLHRTGQRVEVYSVTDISSPDPLLPLNPHQVGPADNELSAISVAYSLAPSHHSVPHLLDQVDIPPPSLVLVKGAMSDFDVPGFEQAMQGFMTALTPRGTLLVHRYGEKSSADLPSSRPLRLPASMSVRSAPPDDMDVATMRSAKAGIVNKLLAADPRSRYQVTERVVVATKHARSR